MGGSIAPLMFSCVYSANAKEFPDTRREAAFALGAIGSERARPTLQSFAAGPDYVLAQVSLEALKKLP